MAEALLISILPAYLGGLALSWGIEWLLQPRPVSPWHRPWAAIGVHIGIWTIAFALELMLFRRPYFSAANVLALELVLVLVSNTKFRMLKEPFVYPDFEYFSDAIKHPRLYLPFLGVWPVLCLFIGYGLAIWGGITLEAILPGSVLTLMFCFVGLAAIGLLIVRVSDRHIGSVSFRAPEDLKHLGLLTTLWRYRVAERESVTHVLRAAPFLHMPVPRHDEVACPDLITIQSESFFDPRSAYSQIRPEVLLNFDVLCRESKQHGSLAVSTWGANTVRTEFAYLTGLSPNQIGVHLYNPYRRLAEHGVATIASYLKSIGYRTICVHPYHAEFYRRDRVLPILGFDEFIDISFFSDADFFGPYVSDRAVGKRIQELLPKHLDGTPVYIHAITMENHGPLHWEQVTADDAVSLFESSVPRECQDLIAYVRHLRNADQMFGDLRHELLRRDRRAGICIFGDHVPIMPKVYEQLGMVDGTTSYVIWDSAQRAETLPSAINVSNVAETYLRHMGLVR